MIDPNRKLSIRTKIYFLRLIETSLFVMVRKNIKRPVRNANMGELRQAHVMCSELLEEILTQR